MKRIIIIYLFFLFFNCVFFLKVFSQENDAGLWGSLNMEKKINPVLSMTLSEEIRMNENITEPGTVFTDAGINYKIGKLLRISLNYRFILKRSLDDSYSKRHRLYLDIAIRKKIKPIVISLRTRFQSQLTDFYTSADGKVPEYYSRNKLTLKLDLDKKYRPYLCSEMFTPLSKNARIILDNARYCAGIEYEFNRMHAVDVFYLIQKEYNVNDPRIDFITGIGYYLTF
jgi:hypothetical protein